MPTCTAWNQMNLENNNATKFNWFILMKNKEKFQRRIALNNHLGVWHYDVIVECNTNCMSWAGHIFFKCNNHVTWSSQFFHQTMELYLFLNLENNKNWSSKGYEWYTGTTKNRSKQYATNQYSKQTKQNMHNMIYAMNQPKTAVMPTWVNSSWCPE